MCWAADLAAAATLFLGLPRPAEAATIPGRLEPRTAPPEGTVRRRPATVACLMVAAVAGVITGALFSESLTSALSNQVNQTKSSHKLARNTFLYFGSQQAAR